MKKETALVLQREGMILIVTVMLIDHLLFSIQEGFILACAIVSATLLAISILRLKHLERKEDRSWR